MRVILILIKKEFLQIFRNPILWKLVTIIPLLQLLIFPFAADMEIKNLRVAIIDNDNSTFTQGFISKLNSSSYFLVNQSIDNINAAEQAMQHDKIDAIIQFTPGFEDLIIRGQYPQADIIANAINSLKAGVGVSYISNVISTYTADYMTNILPGAIKQQPTIEVFNSAWYNKKLDFKNTFVPGVLAVLVTMIGAMLSTMNIVREKELGTIEQLNVTPITKKAFIIGKMIPFLIIGVIEFGIGLIIMKYIYGIAVQGSIPLLMGATILFLIGMLGIGFLVSIMSDNQVQAMFVVIFIFIVFILLSGLFTPIDSMPEWGKALNILNPVYYFMDIIKLIILKGSTFFDIKWQLLILSGYAITFNTLTALCYKKSVK